VAERKDLQERFRAFALGGAQDVFEGALFVAELIDPAEDLDAARKKVDALAARVRKVSAGGADRLAALRTVLFEEEGFRGDTESYDDPSNSSVARVLATRRGLPITLSVVTVEVALRSGLRLLGVGLPGHFVVGGPDLPDDQFLDPFDGGILTDSDALAERVSSLFGSSVELPEEAFLPDAPRSILTRMLFNLRRSYERRNRYADSLAALELAEMLDPEEKGFLRERGLVLLKAGRPQEALAALEAYVASATGEDVEAVDKLIGVLREQALPSGGAELVRPAEKKVFTLDEARTVLPRVKELTSDAVFRYARLGDAVGAEEQRQVVVRDWAKEVLSLGAEIKGLWLVDFDSGAGYYCWKYPETSLEYFHGYEEGFAGRLPLQ
jgi:regulator of sirC expression with transglutaminase-like and TPR domain